MQRETTCQVNDNKGAIAPLSLYGVPKGIRTPVAAVKGQCPRPLDDGDEAGVCECPVDIRTCRVAEPTDGEAGTPRQEWLEATQQDNNRLSRRTNGWRGRNTTPRMAVSN